MSDVMESLANRLSQYLADLDLVQTDVLGFLDQQQMQLAQPKPFDQLEAQSQVALPIVELGKLVARREELLNAARSNGLNVRSLQELAQRLDDSQGALTNNTKVMKRKMETIHHASLSHWISCQKAWLHYSQLVQLIANGGRKAMIPGNTRHTLQGGVILDASV